MFDTNAVYSSFAVDDIAAAQRFYGDTLGLPTETMYEGQILQVDLAGRPLMIYPRPGFTPATYTVLNFPVPDVDKAVDELTSKGIEMARFDGFHQDAKGISHDEGGPTIAWFRDPAGNILAVHDQTPPPS